MAPKSLIFLLIESSLALSLFFSRAWEGVQIPRPPGPPICHGALEERERPGFVPRRDNAYVLVKANQLEQARGGKNMPDYLPFRTCAGSVLVVREIGARFTWSGTLSTVTKDQVCCIPCRGDSKRFGRRCGGYASLQGQFERLEDLRHGRVMWQHQGSRGT